MIKSDEISDLIVNYILNLSEVIKAKEQIDLIKNGYIDFKIDLIPELKESLFENFDINLNNINSIPMRWIKGDTQPHIDRSVHKFDSTYLAYLTNNPGKLIIDGESYPISKGKTYVFSEGLSHETIDTGFEPRLLLGPMNEHATAVGAATEIYANGETEIIYLKYIVDDPIFGTGVIYKINDDPYYTISLPLTIVNTNVNPSFKLQVLFENNLVLDTSIWYIICGSDNIQFGSSTPSIDGSVSIITINGVGGYPGFIKNGGFGTSFPPVLNDGYNNITIQNIGIITAGGSSIDYDAGWLCQQYFSRNASNNNIINCYSTGDIIPGGGGIVGNNAAQNGGSLTINKCFSTGFIDNEAGGIIGNNAANNGGSITITNCYSFGVIGGGTGYGGGIVGSFAEQVNISNCYSLGQISGTQSGGIIGQNYANNGSFVTINNCYSIGDITGTNSGGIASYISSGSATIQNCYTTGSFGSNNGIAFTGPTILNCIAENGLGWNDTNANNCLTGVNSGTWTPIVDNTNYLLSVFNQTIYNQTPYTRTGTLSFQTNPGLIQLADPNFKYTLIKSSNPNISINTNTGVITIGSSIAEGTYVINVLCGVDPPLQYYNYNINSFIFTQSSIPNVPICFPAGTPVLTDQGEIAIEKIDTKVNTIGGKEIVAITESIPLDSYLICIERNSLGPNIPNHRVITTKDHKVMCDNKLVRAEFLIRYIPTIYKVIYNKEKLYNVLLKEHSTMSINNLIVETMNPNHILAKIYSQNLRPEQKNILIQILNKYHIQERKKVVVRNNIFRA